MSSAKLHTELTNANDKKGFETSVGTDVNGFVSLRSWLIFFVLLLSPSLLVSWSILSPPTYPEK